MVQGTVGCSGKVKYVNNLYGCARVYGRAGVDGCFAATRKIAITVGKEYSKRYEAACRGPWVHKLMLTLILESSLKSHQCAFPFISDFHVFLVLSCYLL